MRVELKPDTVERIEKLAGQKMTTRCDRVIKKALDAVEEESESDERPQVKMDQNLLEMTKNG